MSAHSPHPTPYPEINALLQTLLTAVRTILGGRFLGMYLSGSLAMGDFDESSDIDVLVVTTDVLPKETISALATMHARLAASPSRWGAELEASYIPRQAVRRYDPERTLFPIIGRGETLRLEEHGRYFDIHRYIIRERGIVVVGPPPQELIDPVGPNDLRRAVWDYTRWWEQLLENPSALHPRGYRSYNVLTGCRMLYTLEYGTITPKPVAARWAQGELGPRWGWLIDWALEARHAPDTGELDNLSEALDFTRYTLDRTRRFERPANSAQGNPSR